MKLKKYIHKKENGLNKNVVFCTECGEDLELFGMEKVDIQKTKERYRRCKESGKFNGDKCAMLFIAESGDDLLNDDESLNKDL